MTIDTKQTTNIKNGIYTIYDCVLKQFDLPFVVPVTKLNDYMNLIVNDVSSKYFNHESDYIINRIGYFDQESGDVELTCIERIAIADKYIDTKKRKLQTIIQTLNFLPTGYFKMPDEMKNALQEKIDESIKKYVEDYVVPDLDVQHRTDASLVSAS